MEAQEPQPSSLHKGWGHIVVKWAFLYGICKIHFSLKTSVERVNSNKLLINLMLLEINAF